MTEIWVTSRQRIRVIWCQLMEFLTTINHEKFKRGNQRINRIIENAIDNVLERPRRWQTCIRYEYLENKNSKYDFFRFNENCIELKNPAIFKITVKRVSKKIMKYIDGINEYLGEELL